MLTNSGRRLDGSVFISVWSGIFESCAELSFGPNDSVASWADIRLATKTVEQHRRRATRNDGLTQRRMRAFECWVMQKNRTEERFPGPSQRFVREFCPASPECVIVITRRTLSHALQL